LVSRVQGVHRVIKAIKVGRGSRAKLVFRAIMVHRVFRVIKETKDGRDLGAGKDLVFRVFVAHKDIKVIKVGKADVASKEFVDCKDFRDHRAIRVGKVS